MPTGVLEREPKVPSAALIEEARQRQRQRRALFGFLVLFAGALGALPAIAGNGDNAHRSFDSELVGQPRTSNGPDGHTRAATVAVIADDLDIDPRPGVISVEGGVDRLMVTFQAMIRSRSVVEEAVESSGVDRAIADVRRATRTERVAATLLEIAVTDRDRLVATRLANAIADVFVADINAMTPDDPRVAPVTVIFEHAEEIP